MLLCLGEGLFPGPWGPTADAIPVLADSPAGFPEAVGSCRSGAATDFFVQDAEGESEALMISIGDHLVAPDQPGQQIQVYVSGQLPVQGVEFNLQVADGGPELGGLVDGPKIQDIDVLGGTIFSSNNLGTRDDDGPHPDSYPQIEWRSTATESGTVIAEGLLATLTIDTSGFSAGTWALHARDTLNGPTRFPAQSTIVNDGSLTIAADNLPPVARDDRATTVRDSAVAIDVLADNGSGADFDPEGSLLPQSVTATDGQFGTTNVDPVTGRVTYMPQADYTGLDQFSYTVTDTVGATSNPATVFVEILPAGIALTTDGVLRVAGGASDDWVQLRITVGADDRPQLIARSGLWPETEVFPVDQLQRIEIYAGAGNDRVFIAPDVPTPAVIRGGPGRDFLWGGAGDDVLVGDDGNDRLWGRGGNDLLEGYRDDDRLWGEEGDDVLVGGLGLDHLWGGPGENTLEDDAVWPPSQSETDPLLADVNFSGFLSASDVLAIINNLNAYQPQQLQGGYEERPELDVNGDGTIVAEDVLLAINLINSMLADPATGGEGEAANCAGGNSPPDAIRVANRGFARGASCPFQPTLHGASTAAATVGTATAPGTDAAAPVPLVARETLAAVPGSRVHVARQQDALIDALRIPAAGRFENGGSSSGDGLEHVVVDLQRHAGLQKMNSDK
jgi:hypothetical protein